jgi:DNA topoisomerase I
MAQRTSPARRRPVQRRPSNPKQLIPVVAAAVDLPLAARAAGLKYVCCDGHGICRTRAGKAFRYVDAEGKPVRDPETLRRIRSLVLPPAWTDVWICASENGHLQATGYDARGRKQYRYHPRWRAVRDETKYHKMIAFAQALPRIRERVETDLALPGLPRPKILATVVRLLETTLIRVGNEEYARENNSFGLTTMRERHAAVNGATVHFHFRGKSGHIHEIELHDPRLARIVKRSQELPGEELFHYVDEEGQPRSIDSADVNAFLQEIAGEEFTAKDFRTWAGTVLAWSALTGCAACTSRTQAKHNVVAAIEQVAQRLGNTRAVCKKNYVHPAVLEVYLEGTLTPCTNGLTGKLPGLSAEEAAVLTFLQEQLKKEPCLQSVPA